MSGLNEEVKPLESSFGAPRENDEKPPIDDEPRPPLEAFRECTGTVPGDVALESATNLTTVQSDGRRHVSRLRKVSGRV